MMSYFHKQGIEDVFGYLPIICIANLISIYWKGKWDK